MDTPLLLLAWRRPDTVKQVLQAIRAVQPSCMYVACDGPDPSRPGEVEKVAATRSVISEEIDWPCQVFHLYSDTNQGCQLGVSRAITWFFSQVEEGIILEDDCLPHPDFFAYCTILLQRYRHDTRVWCISGNNFQDGRWRGDGGYYFSRYNHCWGWASWRRCWQYYDPELALWPKLRQSNLLATIFENSDEQKYWSRIWDCLLATGKPDSWAYRWTFACLSHGGLTTLPNKNLVVNIGFGSEATHTKNSISGASIPHSLPSINPPSFILRDHQADGYTFRHVYFPEGRGWRSMLKHPGLLLSRAWKRLRLPVTKSSILQ